MRKTKSLLKFDSIQGRLVQYKGYWLSAMKVKSIDISCSTKIDQDATMMVFNQVLKSLNVSTQIVYKKSDLDFTNQINNLESKSLLPEHSSVEGYRKDHVEYIKEVSAGKLDKVSFIIARTANKCSYEEASSYFEGLYNNVSNMLINLNVQVAMAEEEEIRAIYSLPPFIREGVDSYTFGDEVKRTYVCMSYPRNGYPNWLQPIFSFHYPIEISQHFHPLPSEKLIRQLETNVAKLTSTIDMQKAGGYVESSELKEKVKDTELLLGKLVRGEDTILEFSQYFTVSAPNHESLDKRCKEFEGILRQCGIVCRTCRKEVSRGIKSTLPLCDDQLLESMPINAGTLSTFLPFTVQDYVDKDGVLFGLSGDLTELICLDRWNSPNPNTIILGKSGFGKSILAKTDTARHIVKGIQAIIIDHKEEWKDLCSLMGGKYYTDNDIDIDWNHHMIVFGGKSKGKSLFGIWNFIQSADIRQRVLVIEEFHNILREDENLMLQVVKEIRKSGVSPVFITQNVKEFLLSDQGQMIFDNCSFKILMRQGENDLEEVKRLYNLSRKEQIYLKTCSVGRGYLITDTFKTQFKSNYSIKEEKLLSTNPLHVIRRNSV